MKTSMICFRCGEELKPKPLAPKWKGVKKLLKKRRNDGVVIRYEMHGKVLTCMMVKKNKHTITTSLWKEGSSKDDILIDISPQESISQGRAIMAKLIRQNRC